MTFHWNAENLCIIFSRWRITSTVTLLLSLLAVAALTAGYEYVRAAATAYDAHCQARQEGKSPILSRKHS